MIITQELKTLLMDWPDAELVFDSKISKLLVYSEQNTNPNAKLLATFDFIDILGNELFIED